MAVKKEENSAYLELKASIRAKELGRLYFFHGEEGFLLKHYLGQMKKILIDDLTESFNYHHLTNETFSVQEFADAVENLPMMAEHTMVLVEDIDLFKLPEADRNKVGEILSDIPDFCTVVFTYITVAWKLDKRFAKLYEAINSNGCVVSFDKQEQRDLVACITRHFAANKKSITSDLCVYLIELTGGTMTALSGEIAKICAYSGTEQIKKSDIDAVTEPVLDAVAYQMTDFLSKGDYGAALEKLNDLFKMQEEPLMILGTIGATFRRLSVARTLVDNGRNASELMKLYRLPDYAARKTMETARRIRPEFYRAAAGLILETDAKIKTSFDDPERLLELLLLRLAQEARP